MYFIYRIIHCYSTEHPNMSKSNLYNNYTFSCRIRNTSRNAAISITTPFQPIHYDFPKTKFGKQFHSCQGVWFRNFPWLHYDVSRDCLLCYVCSRQNAKLFLESSRNKEDSFITSGFSNWKHALEYLNNMKIQNFTRLLLLLNILFQNVVMHLPWCMKT